MKKVVFLAAALALMFGAGIAEAGAQFRLDATLGVPFYTSPSVQLPVIPIAQAGFQFKAGNLRAGVGIAALIYIVENVIWPDVFLEYELDPFVLRADIGGGRALLVGRFEPATLVAAILPQLELSFKMTDWIRLGVGVLFIRNLEVQSGQVSTREATLPYVGVRLILSGSERSNRR